MSRRQVVRDCGDGGGPMFSIGRPFGMVRKLFGWLVVMLLIVVVVGLWACRRSISINDERMDLRRRCLNGCVVLDI